MPQDPTIPSTGPDSLNSSLRRNIDALRRWREEEEAQATLEERLAAAITRFTGSMRFVYAHLAVYGFWIVANLGWVPGVEQWDPTFVILAMVASVEAIFLSTFILITQNRMAALADKRADLDLQVSLLAEHEITRLITLVTAMAERMGIDAAQDPELAELAQDVAPEQVLDTMDAHQHRLDGDEPRAEAR